jgi:uncharacterized protein (TIGR02246 family)
MPIRKSSFILCFALASFASGNGVAFGQQPVSSSQVGAQTFENVQISETVRSSRTPDKEAIETTIAGYFKALNTGDLDAVLRLYSSDPVILPFLQPTVVGTDAVRQNYVDTFKHIHFQMHTTILELVRMSPEWAFVRTDSAGTFTPTRSGVSAPSTFHELFLLHKTGTGKWHIARYSFSPMGPLPAV